jgi:hypothetical protein
MIDHPREMVPAPLLVTSFLLHHQQFQYFDSQYLTSLLGSTRSGISTATIRKIHTAAAVVDRLGIPPAAVDDRIDLVCKRPTARPNRMVGRCGSDQQQGRR